MGFGRNTDKRGNTSGGSSTGRSGQKRGGKDSTADPNTQVDRGTLTCPKCSGSGQVAVPRMEGDEDGTYAGEDYKTCTKCGGSGTVKG